VSRNKILSNDEIITKFPFFTMNELGGYGVMILTKHPCYFYEVDFEVSTTGRKLMIAEPLHGINGRHIVIGTAHFESKASKAAERKA